MGTGDELAAIFRSIADLLDLAGERFKPEAYRRAARSLESLGDEVRAIAARGDLRSIPGVGDAIAEKIEEYLRTGRIDYYERVRETVPEGVRALLAVEGIGPKTARRLWVELGVDGPGPLAAAIADGRLRGVAGFGPTRLAKIAAALRAASERPEAGRRRPIESVYPVAVELAETLRRRAVVDEAEVAGSVRRFRETVGDVDLLVTSRTPAAVFDVVSALPIVAEVVLRGPTKETVRTRDGLQIDVRVVAPESFGAALQYFTGSKEHNVRLRSLAREAGLKINEYGVYRGDERVAGRTEADVYAALGLPVIPPELREDRGEIDLARRGRLPELVERSTVRGDLHVHWDAARGPDDVAALAAEGVRRGLSYLGVVVRTVDADGAQDVVAPEVDRAIRTAAVPGIRLYRAVEVPFGAPEPSDGERTGDYVIRTGRVVRPAGPGGPGRAGLGAHLSLASESERAAVFDLAARTGVALEVGPGPGRLGPELARRAVERGIRLHLPTGIGAAADRATGDIALGFARRAGVGAAAVVNTAADPGPALAGGGLTPRPSGRAPRAPGPPRPGRRR